MPTRCGAGGLAYWHATCRRVVSVLAGPCLRLSAGVETIKERGRESIKQLAHAHAAILREGAAKLTAFAENAKRATRRIIPIAEAKKAKARPMRPLGTALGTSTGSSSRLQPVRPGP